MRHVAALAGVGIKTVSRVINDEPGVSEATRQKDALLIELHHRVGNQLAKLSALARKEMRAGDPSASTGESPAGRPRIDR